MYALTIDQRASRSSPDGVPRLLTALMDVDTALPFERTAGDEVQGLLSSPAAVIDAIERVLRAGRWSIGLGIGPVEPPLPESVREARGVALLRAREAVEAAKRSSSVHLAVRAGVPTEAEPLLRLVGTTLQRRTATQWRVADAARIAQTQTEAADALGISVQAVSQSLLASSEDVLRATYPLLERLLTEADEGSGA